MPRKESYPWDVWFNGKEYQLQRGIDFNIPVDYFQSTVYRTLKRKNLSGNFRAQIVDENTVIISPSNNLIVYERAELIGREATATNQLIQQQNNSVQRKTNVDIIQYPMVVELFNKVFNENKEKKIIKRPKRDPITNKFLLLQDLKDANGNNVYLPGQVSNKLFQYEEVEVEVDLPKEITLYYPNDIPVSPKLAASRIRNAAMIKVVELGRNDIDPTKWDYEWDKNKLVIKFGQLGVDSLIRKRELEREQKQYDDLLINIKQNDLIPITIEKVNDWLYNLKQNSELTLIKGKDYSCTSDRVLSILYASAYRADLRLYEATLTAEKDRVIVDLTKLDEMAVKGVGYNALYVNEDYKRLLENKEKLVEYKRKLQLAKDTNTEKAIKDFERRISLIEEENKLIEDTVKKPILQPYEIKQLEEQEQQKQKQLEEQQEQEEQARIEGQQQITSQTSQPRTYTIPELQQKIILAKQKNNVTALRIFREKLAALGGKEE